VVLHSEAFNVQGGWLYKPLKTEEDNERPKIAVSSIVVVRITAPADAVTMNGTIKWREYGILG
jgi:hypothetical protein